MPVPAIDHIVIDVQDRMDEAAERYRALGFQLTDRAHHSLGSSNHLSIFKDDYLELLSPGAGKRPELTGFPVGMNGLVFAMKAAEAVHEGLVREGLPTGAVQQFTRGVDLPGGATDTAAFKTVRLEPRSVFDGRVYFCEHLTPHLVWRPEWQVHPNGALALTRVALAAADPARVAAVFERMFGKGAVTKAAGAPLTLQAGKVAVEIWQREALAQSLGHAMPDPSGRGDHMAAFGLRVRSLADTAAILRARGIDTMASGPDRLLVPAAAAFNVAIEFTA